MLRFHFFYLSLSLLFSLPSFAQGGGNVGNGGNGMSAILSSAIVHMDLILARHCASDEKSNDVLKLRACAAEPKLFSAILKTKIGTRYIVYGKSDYQARDAINDLLSDGNFFVTFSLKRLYESTPEQRRRVILHEFMTLIQLETSDSYGYSTLVLEYLGSDANLANILIELPAREFKPETFRALETTVKNSESKRPVLLQNADDFNRFCISKGFSHFSSLYSEDLDYKQWAKINQNDLGAVILDNQGMIVQVVEHPDPKARVIQTATCE